MHLRGQSTATQIPSASAQEVAVLQILSIFTFNEVGSCSLDILCPGLLPVIDLDCWAMP